MDVRGLHVSEFHLQPEAFRCGWRNAFMDSADVRGCWDSELKMLKGT